MVDKSSQTSIIKNPQQHAHPDYPRFHVPAEKEKSSDCSLSKHFICSKCCLALLEISCQSNVSLHVCPKSISSFESYIHNSRQRNSILSEVLERVGLAGILGIMGALYRQPARITYAGLRSAWCNGREIRQTFRTFSLGPSYRMGWVYKWNWTMYVSGYVRHSKDDHYFCS